MRGNSTFERIWTSAFALFCGAVLFGVAVMKPAFPVEVHHNVYVWSRIKGLPQAWWIGSDDGLGFRTFNCCPDFPCERFVEAGYVASKLAYEERGDCESIRDKGLGFWWDTYTDSNGTKQWKEW
jgi:hypothetical protein